MWRKSIHWVTEMQMKKTAQLLTSVLVLCLVPSVAFLLKTNHELKRTNEAVLAKLDSIETVMVEADSVRDMSFLLKLRDHWRQVFAFESTLTSDEARGKRGYLSSRDPNGV